MQPKVKVEDKDKFTQDFLNTLDDINLIVVDVIPAGAPDSPSSAFNSYKVKDNSSNEFIITLGGGSFGNAGMNYEREILKKLEDYLNIAFTDLDKGKSFERRVKRPLTDEGPQDKGDEISDITFIDEDNNKYYVSIKNVGGKTVSNAGAKGMFKQKDDEVEFSNQERNKIGGKLLSAANVNVEKIIRGLEDYIKETPSQPDQDKSVNTTEQSDIETLQKFLGSAFDYGYIYVKQKNKKDDLEIADLTTEEGLYNFVGDIQQVEVKYPYYKNSIRSRKHASIVLTTSKGVYSFDIRNASGGVVPDQINLVRGGSKKDEKLNKANISKIDLGTSELENILSQND